MFLKASHKEKAPINKKKKKKYVIPIQKDFLVQPYAVPAECISHLGGVEKDVKWPSVTGLWCVEGFTQGIQHILSVESLSASPLALGSKTSLLLVSDTVIKSVSHISALSPQLAHVILEGQVRSNCCRDSPLTPHIRACTPPMSSNRAMSWWRLRLRIHTHTGMQGMRAHTHLKGWNVYVGSQFQRIWFVLAWPHALEQNITVMNLSSVKSVFIS